MNELAAGRITQTLDDRLSRLFGRKEARTVSQFQPLVFVGLETRKAGDPYEWRGPRRTDSSDNGGRRRVLFQYTLQGWGEFTGSDGRPIRVEEGMAFAAILPSAHVYRLPRDSPGWRFFWVMIHHPYVVERLAAAGARRGGEVQAVPVNGLLAGSAAALWSTVCRGTAADTWAQEEAILQFLLTYERHSHALAHPAGPRERLLAEARSLVAERPAGIARPSVEELARRHGMSRSHFSHHFRALTGQTPAAVLLSARLSRAAKRLSTGDDKLERIARETGFADATSLCRTFRRHYHVSPNQFRLQVNGG